MSVKLKKKLKTKKRISKKLFQSLFIITFIKKSITSYNKTLTYLTSFAISLILFLSICGLYLFIQTQHELSAVIADDILRPTVGSEKTIALEAVFFYFQDQINQIKYSFSSKPAQPVAKIATISALLVKTPVEEFVLNYMTPVSSASAVPGDGLWSPVQSGTYEANLNLNIVKTTFHPDPNRLYAVATIVKMNMNKLNISAVAGFTEPGGTGNPGPGKVPPEIQKSGSLSAAFNGGFKKNDGHYGMIVGDKVYEPLASGAATLILYKDKKPEIFNYRGQKINPDALAVRQNGPLLVDNSKISTDEKTWDTQNWGLTITNDMYTWRSGVGVDKQGNFIYACGPSLIPYTLALTLKTAGAVNAMQLDINPAWVRFSLFDYLGNGSYKYESLVSDMINGGEQYLNGFQRDFFYVYKK